MESNEMIESYYRLVIARELKEKLSYVNEEVINVVLGVRKEENKDDK